MPRAGRPDPARVARLLRGRRRDPGPGPVLRGASREERRPDMNWAPAEKIARTVLYEGYLLYPYRRSALKNTWRWTFGVVAPGASTGLDCLLEATPATRIVVKVKHLREVDDRVEERETVL